MLIIDTLFDGTVSYTQRTELDGTEYQLRFDWNDRRQRWTFGILALDDTPILTGQTVSLNIPLNRRQVGGPPGVLVAYSEDTNAPPGLLDLGARVKLVYYDAASAEADAAELAT